MTLRFIWQQEEEREEQLRQKAIRQLEERLRAESKPKGWQYWLQATLWSLLAIVVVFFGGGHIIGKF
jgi:hypothetical protein